MFVSALCVPCTLQKHCVLWKEEGLRLMSRGWHHDSTEHTEHKKRMGTKVADAEDGNDYFNGIQAEDWKVDYDGVK